MRLLPVGATDVCGGVIKSKSQSYRQGYRYGHVREYLQVRHLSPHQESHSYSSGFTKRRRYKMKNTNNISRRNFIRATGGLGGGLIISFMIPAYASARLKAIFDKKDDAIAFAPNAFLHIQSDNSIKVLLSHVEMGQG